MMSIETMQGHPLFFDEVIGKPEGNDCWVNGVNNATPWRILERRVTQNTNIVQIVQATGEEWWVKVVGVKSGNTKKAVAKVACAATYNAFQDAKKSEYKSGELVEPFGVTADFFFGIAMLSKAELFTMARPMEALAKAGGRGQPETPAVDESKAAQEADELSAKIAIAKQTLEELSSRNSELKNEIARSQELLSELDSDIDVKLLADSDKYSLASYPDVPHIPLYEISDVRKHFKGKAGIYFAISRKHGGIEYVGRSEDLGTRVSPGRDELRGCVISILQMPEWETHAAELAYIAACRPARNAQIQRAHNGRVNAGTPKEYLSEAQARDYIARRTRGHKTLQDAIVDGLKVKAISSGKDYVSVVDIKEVLDSKWCREEIQASYEASKQGEKLKRGIKF